MAAFLPVLFGSVAGLVAGSFLATVVVRWPRGESLAGRSHCDGCGRILGAIELLPVLSWALLGGRCRGCATPIDRRHVAIEGMAALIGALAFYAAYAAPGMISPGTISPAAAGPGMTGLAGALLGWSLLALTVLDCEQFWLPDRITLPLLALGIAIGGAGGMGDIVGRLLGAALAGGLLLLLALGYRRLRGRDGLGLGDVKLAAALGAWLGPLAIGPLLALAAAAGLLLAAVRRGHPGPLRVPFGACLAVTAFPLWLFQAAGGG